MIELRSESKENHSRQQKDKSQHLGAKDSESISATSILLNHKGK